MSRSPSPPPSTFLLAHPSSLLSTFPLLLLPPRCNAMQLRCIALHSMTLRCIALRCIALHCVALHCIVMQPAALHCVAFAFYVESLVLHLIALQRGWWGGEGGRRKVERRGEREK